MAIAASNGSCASPKTVGQSVDDEPPRMDFWRNHPGLVWSNENASDAVRIRAALLKPSFSVLLAIAVAFGPNRLEQEWRILCADSETDTDRVQRFVTPILANIRRGYEQARA